MPTLLLWDLLEGLDKGDVDFWFFPMRRLLCLVCVDVLRSRRDAVSGMGALALELLLSPRLLREVDTSEEVLR